MESRFPFREIAVSPNGSRAVTWLLSGTPRFDEVGRFLGFRGFATPATPERQEQSEADRLGRFDSLTGLPNRAQMEALLDEALANSDRRKQSCALFLIDLDRFKQVNDTLGHPAGDVLLQRVAERLNAVIGGEGQAGPHRRRRIRSHLSRDRRGRPAGGDRRPPDRDHLATLSDPRPRRSRLAPPSGIAISRPGRTYRQALIKEADLALYSAKRAGRGTSRFFEPEMHAQENDRRVLESDLKSAVAKGQLKLLFQPIVSVATETVVGFEALVRWSHPTRGRLPPSDFLAIAEASGQMPVLGEWILRAACDEAASWPVHLRLAVNVTKGQLNPGFAAMLTNALASSGLSPDRLDLEVQEAVLTGEDPAAREALLAAHQLGVALCLDDFGCGPTSLTSLKDVPLDRLKLHPTFLTSALNKNARGRTLATALMRLAEGLGMQVTAEGAERLEELQLIRSLGCDHVQGYLFGRPMGQAEARPSLPRASRSTPRRRPSGGRRATA
jgi:predicted signal transduction protein with EAL and GGDEF domain